MFSCPNCGGALIFDIPSLQLACTFCSTKFDPYLFDDKEKDAETQPDPENYEATIFTCPQCGGEILSTDNSAAEFCSFCGASTILMNRLSKEKRPGYIIPFQKTKEECKQAYGALLKSAIFAPKELKDPACIDSFRGIYMPYWSYYITQRGPLKLPAQHSYDRGDYTYTDHYTLTGELDSYYKGLSYDASSSFADNISEAIAPYDVKGMKAFTPAYLSGFYADTADVPAEVYQPEAEAIATAETAAGLTGVAPFNRQPLLLDSPNAQALHTKTERVDRSMFPVWFMSYRKGDRVAYATVNGQTGKVVADLPVDVRRYFLGALLTALPIFLILNLILTVTPKILMGTAAVFSMLIGILYAVQVYHIRALESGKSDKGLTYYRKKAPVSELTHEKVSPKGMPVAAIVLFLLVGLFLLGFNLITHTSFLWMLALILITLILLIGLYGTGGVPRGHRHALGPWLMFAATAEAMVTVSLNPVADWFYYLAAALMLAGVALMELDVIGYYNVMSTRQLPQFERKGGDDRA